jgi:virginiamycin B lyase
MNRRQFLASSAALLAVRPSFAQEGPFRTRYYPISSGIGLHDLAPAPDGTVWFTAQGKGLLGRLDPNDGSYKTVSLGEGAAPHGVTIGPDGAPWITEGGQNAIARVDPSDLKVTLFRLPEKFAYANLNTGVFDKAGTYWFTGQSGYYGRLKPNSGGMDVFRAPKGVGPYGITVTPKGDVWYASLAGSYIAKIDLATGNAAVVEPPTPSQGSRRVWSDSNSRIWVSEWNSGHVSVHDPAGASWSMSTTRTRCG